MKIIKLSTLALVLLVSGISTVKAQDGKEIMKKHIAAMGGNKWDDVKTMKMDGSINARGMEINITQTLNVAEKKMRMDMAVMGTNNYVIVTPDGGWAYMPAQGSDKVISLPMDAAKMQTEKMNYKGMYLVDESKIKLAEYLGKDTVNTIPCYKVKITDNEDNTQTAYIDMNTYYMVRTEMKAKVQDQEQEVALSYSNFQKFAPGVVMPMVLGTDQGDITFKTIELNKPIDEKLFKPEVPTATQTDETEPPKKEISK